MSFCFVLGEETSTTQIKNLRTSGWWLSSIFKALTATQDINTNLYLSHIDGGLGSLNRSLTFLDCLIDSSRKLPIILFIFSIAAFVQYRKIRNRRKTLASSGSGSAISAYLGYEVQHVCVGLYRNWWWSFAMCDLIYHRCCMNGCKVGCEDSERGPDQSYPFGENKVLTPWY